VIGEFAVNDGILTPIGTIPVSTGAGAAGLATN